jgi:hypothetical protein
MNVSIVSSKYILVGFCDGSGGLKLEEDILRYLADI